MTSLGAGFNKISRHEGGGHPGSPPDSPRPVSPSKLSDPMVPPTPPPSPMPCPFGTPPPFGSPPFQPSTLNASPPADLAPHGISRDQSSSTIFELSSSLSVQYTDKFLGTGAFGEVWKGILKDENGVEQEVAMKFVNRLAGPHAKVAIDREVKAFETVPPHKNIIRFVGKYTEEDGQDEMFIVEEYMPRNMSHLIHEDPEFVAVCTFGKLLDLFIQITEGLQHLDKHSVVHYDLKPENVLMDEHMTVKIADFGASKIRLRETITASVRGTIGYIAPEAFYGGIANKRTSERVGVKQAVDVFALGVIMWECVMRRKVGDCADACEIMESGDNTVNWAGRSVRCLCPDRLKRLIERCLDFDLQEFAWNRPTCEEIMVELGEMLNEGWVNDRPPRWDEAESVQEVEEGVLSLS